VRRKTGGRPRLVLAVDKQPMQLPLGYTIVDLEDILAPGAYLLDIVDAKGELLGLTIGASIGQLRNGDASGGDEDGETPTMAPLLPSTGSETRLVLEANVRATQMAFQHNQKTLELGLRMAETLRDGVHVLADAQAEWIKSLSSARGFFRNAAPPPPALPSPAPSKDEDEDDEDDGYEEGPSSLIETVGPLVAMAAEKIATTIMQIKMGGGGASTDVQFGDLFDWRRPAQRNRAAREKAERPQLDAAEAAAPPLATARANTRTLEAMVEADPKLKMHLFAIMAALSEEERRHAQAAAKILSDEDRLAWLNSLKAMSVSDAVQQIRGLIAQPAAQT
ncbi:MAG TPA: hypothetical protein VFV99_04510, partial [Kofleriaceae bacterium]|nr:hypothetical protein [Kofleriaceae bacterium]